MGLYGYGPISCLEEACYQRDRSYSRLVVENNCLPCYDLLYWYGAGLAASLGQDSLWKAAAYSPDDSQIGYYKRDGPKEGQRLAHSREDIVIFETDCRSM